MKLSAGYSGSCTGSLLLVAALLVSTVLLSTGCAEEERRGTATDPPTFRHDGTLAFESAEGDTLAVIDIEIADTDQARAQGLMHRRSMSYDRGMLFVFDEVGTGSMWMRNTPLPLDMIFVDDDEEIINIVERTRPFSDAEVSPEAPRRYVVEVRAGFVDRHNIGTDARIRWTRIDE